MPLVHLSYHNYSEYLLKIIKFFPIRVAFFQLLFPQRIYSSDGEMTYNLA